MTERPIEHLAIKTGEPAATTAAGFLPPLPVRLWLPPAACLCLLSAGLVILCLSGTQSPQPGVGWLEPRQAPLLLAWLTALTAVFLAPQFGVESSGGNPPVLARPAKRWLQALAVGLPVAGVTWAFHAVVVLLDTNAARQPVDAATPGFATLLPAGFLLALAVGAVCTLSWLWHRLWPRASVVVLAAWAGLPPLAWFLAVDVMGRDQADFPAELTVNPVYTLVLLSRDPQALPAWSLPALLTILAAVPLTAALIARLRRKPAPDTPVLG